MQFLTLALDCYLAAVLGIAGFAKLDAPAPFAATLRQQHLLPSWSVGTIGRLFPWLEITLAGALLSGIAAIRVATFTILKFAFITVLPYEGGIISGARIRAWLTAMTEAGYAVFGRARDETGKEYEWLHDSYESLAAAEADATLLTTNTADPDLIAFTARRVLNVR